MERELIKIIHPIGQGAFISERHDNFNVVYDCGVDWPNRNSKYVYQLVKNSFAKGATIDILFISHFDYDHISKIPILQTNFRIKKVVMPFISSENRFLLSELYKGMGVTQDIQSIIDSPQDFFSESQIIEVQPFENNEEETQAPTIQIDDIKTPFITSGTKLRIDFWEYIPFNLDHLSRSKQFLSLLKAEGIDPKKLSKHFVYTEQLRKKLKRLYEKVKGDINQNSMVIYSGPINPNISALKYYDLKQSISLFPRYRRTLKNRISSVYTGDSSMNDYDLKNIFGSNWKKVIMFQIPHHGDIKSVDIKQLSKDSYICPINFGSYNTYGHPSNNVLAELGKNDQYIKLVTEDPSSILMIKILYETK
ncbi:MBL fold metallo-hydrolase [uncultured Psychroserpens sp.]|uniref:MBL fold metallo-hydrolase n=1 Tax=uncultured Psychroserpens sp. TaxID=255436 RepID=UPI0026372D33|nr:MBL fold metallo-hydrolase [uncultured Psychroserpens sp.]